MTHKKLLRSKTNRVFAGVCGGLAEYANIDPTVTRLLTVILIILTGFFPGVFLYIIGIFVIPDHVETTPTV